MDELGRINIFIKVVEAGSFSAVARDVSSISAISRQIKSLENDLGVRLLNRSTRALSLTEPGRLFYERVRGISRDLSSAFAEAESFQNTAKGVLKVTMRVTVGTLLIIPALPAFLEQYPDLILDISLSDERCDLITENVDVAICTGHLPDSDIVARRLCPSQRIVCASPSYLERYGTPQTPQELASHSCLLLKAPSYSNKWTFSRGEESEEVLLQGKISSDNGTVLVTSALAGLGLMIVHKAVARSLIEQKKLIQVLADYTVNPIPGDADLYAVYSSSRGMSRKVRVFLDFLVKLFSEPESGK